MGNQPIIVAPAVSVIVGELRKRSAWQLDQEFMVPADLYREAEAEMLAIMKKRGFPLARAKNVKADNFMIYGSVIVSNG